MVHAQLKKINLVQILVHLMEHATQEFVNVHKVGQVAIAVNNHALIIVILMDHVWTESVNVSLYGLEMIVHNKLIYVQLKLVQQIQIVTNQTDNVFA